MTDPVSGPASEPQVAPQTSSRSGTIDIARASELARRVLDEVDRAVVGKREALTLVLAGVLAGGHVLMEDFPGLGKTLAAGTRTHGDVLMGASPRGALGLLLCSRAYAVIDGRDYVTPEDVKAVALPVLAHRITVKPELWMSDVTGASVVSQLLESVPSPPAREDGPDRTPTEERRWTRP